MKERLVTPITAAVTGLLGSALMGLWFFQAPLPNLTTREPGADGRKESQENPGNKNEVKIGQYFQKYSGAAAPSAGSWPAFRGKDRDDIDRMNKGLSETWPESGPPILWSIDLGEGHAGPAVHGGKVYLLDYDEARKSDSLRCLSLADGKEIWRRWYTVPIKRNHGLSRTVPAVTDKYAVTIGPLGHVMCVDSQTGAFVWGIDMVREYGTLIPDWYTGQCPLIDQNMAILAPAGSSLLIGADLASGKIAFKTPNKDGFKMSHSSVMVMTLDGRRIYLYSSLGGLAGVSAEKGDLGKILFVSREWSNSVIAPSLVAFPDGRIYATAGYGAGSALLTVSRENGAYSIRKIYSMKPEQGFSCEQQTPILIDGLLFGVLPKDGGPYRNQFACYDPQGRFVWTSGKEHQFGLGPYLYADNKFFILSDDGELTMAAFSRESFKVLSHCKIIDGRDCWAPLALADGKLLLRSSKKMLCIGLN